MSVTPVDYIFKSQVLLVECRDNIFKTTFTAIQLKPFVLMKKGLLLHIKSNFLLRPILQFTHSILFTHSDKA